MNNHCSVIGKKQWASFMDVKIHPWMKKICKNNFKKLLTKIHKTDSQKFIGPVRWTSLFLPYALHSQHMCQRTVPSFIIMVVNTATPTDTPLNLSNICLASPSTTQCPADGPAEVRMLHTHICSALLYSYNVHFLMGHGQTIALLYAWKGASASRLFCALYN